jgi:hypothetical protein
MVVTQDSDYRDRQVAALGIVRQIKRLRRFGSGLAKARAGLVATAQHRHAARGPASGAAGAAPGIAELEFSPGASL